MGNGTVDTLKELEDQKNKYINEAIIYVKEKGIHYMLLDNEWIPYHEELV